MTVTLTKSRAKSRQRRWIGRILWVVMALIAVLMIAIAIPKRFSMLASDVYGYGTALTDLGLTFLAFAFYFTALEAVIGVSFVAIGGVIAWRKASDWLALIVATTFALFGMLLPLIDGLIAVEAAWQPVVVLLRVLVYSGLFAILCLFPDGRFVPSWSRWYLLAWGLFALVFWRPISATLADMAIIPSTRTLNDGLALLVTGSWTTIGLWFQLSRYRSYASTEQRQQTKWVLFGLLFVAAVSLVNALLLTLFPILREDARSNLIFTLSMGTILLLAAMVLSLTVAVALLRYRLFDIDILINRTLVYSGLTAATVGMYVLLVGGVGSLLQLQGSTAIAFVATGVVAVLFQPLRVRLQTAVDRLMYGQRDDPVGMLTHLAQRLETVDSPEGILPTLAETIATALKLPHVSLWLPESETQWEPAAVYGPKTDTLHMIPLLHQNQEIGRLFVAPRGPGERFSREDKRLLATIAQLSATTVQAAQLSVELQQSRRQIVTSREEERRRLRRDLHDGLGPVLASVALQADTARDLVDSDPTETKAILSSIMDQAQTAVTDVRQLVYELRPPALDELGLAGALRQAFNAYQHQLEIQFEVAELPPLPAAVEVAAYRIVQEAVNNVVKHARASHCTVTIGADGGLLLIIADNGVGIKETATTGVGLISMKERATELGGQCTIQYLPVGGTQVTAVLPLPSEEHP